MTKATATVLVAVGITMFVGLITMFGGIDLEDFIAWIVVVTLCLSIIGYAWHADKVKRAREH